MSTNSSILGTASIFPADAGTRLSLTRRGRLVFIGLPLMVLAASLLTFVGFFTAPAMASGFDNLNPTDTVSVSVPSGGSLWNLALEYSPDRDPRDVVFEIVELNDLGTSTVQAGQQIFVPVSR
ncbi:peptidoglycan-binding protein [Arthrobacter roseus]|uniref:peptidoglycan-binding protein n=1 Tax=Arthrobacter roseus TaxID=136274 RepID=UPI0019657AF5|nr:peptidoglycan-binding protein [Arthrobacter roseus]MBM7848249.1 hypothetical protein [Arthrobacter roseus]